MVLGPSSSRLYEASSVFVAQVEARDPHRKGAFLYGFSEKPELSLEKNWAVSSYVIVSPYSRKGFNLWLNEGSRIRMRWEAQTSSLDQLEVSLIKGERKFETLIPTSPTSPALFEPTAGRVAEYAIQESDRYYIGIVNANPKSIIMAMNLNVSSKIYDTTKANTMCSTSNGSCRLNLLFPITQFVAVTTPNNGDLGEWYMEISFIARIATYIVILGLLVITVLLILKLLGACDSEAREEVEAIQEVTEADPLMPDKPFQLLYGTGEDEESGSSSCSEDLYDGKICVICYEEPRNCFFVPCGHCATCHSCAQRIINGEKKVCPICRRLIHKVRKLLIP
ncbi:E3 ubiquitin-protein ligase APD2 isoform X2 [Diospyros lotus]|nr:E3 ubiquitin-protein ligase APD2 isoform X2 [Diospyros lotus]